MNTKSQLSGNMEDMEEKELHSMLSEQLPVLSAAPKVMNSIQQRLGRRIADSVARHAGLSTVRARDGIWKQLVKGIRYKELWKSSQGNSVLIEFAPGAALPVHRHLYQEEGIVLRGSLQHEDEDLQLYDYHLSPAGSRHGRISSKGGALAFLRGTSIGHTPSVLREIISCALPFKGGESRTVYFTHSDWEQIAPGVFKKNLHVDGDFASSIFRLEAGASVASHVHPQDEECMMLEGELFLGDILLRTGEYQLAPAGTSHGEVSTDVGALLFVRGAAE